MSSSSSAMPTRQVARGASLLLYTSGQFFVLTIVAMFLYPGGTHLDPSAAHYEFTRNFFSDLGATRIRVERFGPSG